MINFPNTINIGVANIADRAYKQTMSIKRWTSPRGYINHVTDEIMKTEGSAAVVASSFTVGTFFALLPTFGLGIFLALLVLIIFPNLHKPSTLLAFVVWNPLVQIPLYTLSIAIGAFLFSGMPVVSFDFVWIDHVYNVTRRVLVGNLIVTASLSVISYCTIFVIIRKLKGRKIFS